MRAFSFTLVLAIAACSSSADLIDEENGFDDPILFGRTFVVSNIQSNTPAIAGVPNCGNAENCLRGLSGISWDSIIFQSIRSGDTLLLVEIAGHDAFDLNQAPVDRATLKFYRGYDADEPRFPANDFGGDFGAFGAEPPNDEDKASPFLDGCCQFLADERSVDVQPLQQARFRVPIALDETNEIRTVGEGSLPAEFWPVVAMNTLSDDCLSHPIIELERAVVTGQLRDELLTLRIDAVVPVSELSRVPASLCFRPQASWCDPGDASKSLLDILARVRQPDVDVDGDGFEVFRSNGTCIDGDGSEVMGRSVDSLSCTRTPQMADGYRMRVEVTAEPASVVGFTAWRPRVPENCE